MFVPLEAMRSGQFSLSVHLTTPGGVSLGQYARLEVTSTNYGTITLVVTGTAAAALVLLLARRIRRRVKAEQPATAGPAAPTGDTAPVGAPHDTTPGASATANGTDSITTRSTVSTDQQQPTPEQDQPRAEPSVAADQQPAPAAGQERTSQS